MNIDIQTATYFSISVHAILFILLLVYARVAKQYDGVYHWALWNIIFACGMAVWSLGGPVPPWFSIIFGNTLMVFAGCFAYLGSTQFVKNQPDSSRIFALPAIILLLYFYFTLYDDNVIVRRVSLSLAGSTIFLATAYVILKAPSRPLATSYRFTGVIFVLYGVVLLLRAILVPVFSPKPSPLDPSFEQALIFLLSPLFGLLIAVGFGLMIMQRLLAELQSTTTSLEQEHSQTKIMLENLAVGVVACDSEGRFTLVNHFARNFYKRLASAKSIEQMDVPYPMYLPDGQTRMKLEERPLYRALRGEKVRDMECVLLSEEGQPRHFLVNASPLMTPQGECWGSIAVFADITEQKQAAEAQAKLFAELQQTMKEVKTLRGLVPICAHCKNVRDDSGFWQQVEVYMRQRTDAEFSHAICPDCLEKHYGNYLRSESP